MKKFIKVISFVFILALIITGCSSTKDKKKDSGKKSDLKVGVVLTTSGRGDKSFNDSALAGLERAEAELGVKFKEVQPKELAETEKSLEFLAKEKYNLIFAIGFNAKEAVVNVATKYPDTQFAIIDLDFGDEILPNVTSLVFAEEQSSFLAGVLAAEMSQTNVVGFVGGMESPLIAKWEIGFEAGAKATKPDIKVISTYISSDATGFKDTTRAKEITLDMISKKVDVVYHGAGGSGQGVFDAAAEKGIYAIGTDSNQEWVKPGTVIASMLKRVDNATYYLVDEANKGNNKGGTTIRYDLESQGVGLSDLSTFDTTIKGVSEADTKKINDIKAKISKETIKKIETFTQEIIDGKVVVPSTK